VGGKQVIKNRNHVEVNEDAILKKAAEWQAKIAIHNSSH
jgi:hypothetical protein